MLGLKLGNVKQKKILGCCPKISAEEQGFEPRVLSQVRLISSQVHSTALPLFRIFYKYINNYSFINSSLSK